PSNTAVGCCKRVNRVRKAERCSTVGLNRKRILLTFPRSSPAEPSRQVGGKPGGAVERRDDLAHESRVGLPITAQGPVQGVLHCSGAQRLRQDAPGQAL